MRAVVYKKPFEVAVGEGPGPQAGHPDDVIFRALSAAGQAKDQLSGEGTPRALALSATRLSLTEASAIAQGKARATRAFNMSARDLTSLRQPGQPLLGAGGARAAWWDKTKKWPQSPRSSNEARLSRQLGEARRPSRSGGNANGYRFYA
jgi:hypothetical protein